PAAGGHEGYPRSGRRSRPPGRRVPRRAEDHLMAATGPAGAIWVHGESAPDGSLARISTEVATLARTLGEEAGCEVVGIVVGADPSAAAAELATYVPRVLAISEPASATGTVEPTDAPGELRLPQVEIVDRVEAATTAAPIEEARIIVSGGRGVGGPEGFKLVEEIAEALGGAVGATRAAVDAGWIPYAQQIGQTGKIVKPALYLALGISGAIQHKVGMQTAETIVAVNRDPDAPIADFADLVVIGDLFEVGPALLAALRARAG